MLQFTFVLAIALLGVSVQQLTAKGNEKNCNYHGLSRSIAIALCEVENGIIKIENSAVATESTKKCYIGKNRCNEVLQSPNPDLILPSKPPPAAKNKKYQELATIAERSVPETWWRKSFADDLLLLSHNNDELPTKLFESNSFSNKKLKNIYQCVSRQQFMRKSYNFEDMRINNCSAIHDVSVKLFFIQWKNSFYFQDSKLGGISSQIIASNAMDSGLYESALKVLNYFYTNFGGIWTGCFGLELISDCRGALAAASMIVAHNKLGKLSSQFFSESELTEGYILSSLGRGLLHGDTSGTGDISVTSWKLKLGDFVALQSAFLKLYISSIGSIYTTQLNYYVPFTFSPGFVVTGKTKWAEFSNAVEPVYTSLRNWMFTECSNLIDFGPYYPLVGFSHVRDHLLHLNLGRRVLIDIGANGFFASPKYLIDSYSVYLPFTHAIMVEPEPHFSATIPKAYSDKYNISFLPIYAEVGTGSETDMLRLLPTLVSEEDFVVLKFDVDPNRFAQGPTMEWGFLFEITQRPDIASLIDEVYIELHFHFPALYWQHYHSNWEALDIIRYLRNNGIVVHSWP